MTQLSQIQLEDGTILYIESTENLQLPTTPTSEEPESEEPAELTRDNLGKGSKSFESIIPPPIDIGDRSQSAPKISPHRQSSKAIENTIRQYTDFTLNALRKVAIANIDKVTLEFGIEVGGEAGIPYVTKGTAKSNLKIKVECSFPNSP